MGNSLAIVHQVIETGYHKVQQFHYNTLGNRTKKRRFTHKSVHECLYQHYSQLSKCGDNPNVHQLVKRSTKCCIHTIKYYLENIMQNIRSYSLKNTYWIIVFIWNMQSSQICTSREKTLASWKKSYDQPRHHIKKQRHYLANKGPSSQSYITEVRNLSRYEGQLRNVN